MYYRSGYETSFTLDIDDDEAVQKLQGSYELEDEFMKKLQEQLQYTDVKYEARVDLAHKKVEVIISFEGLGMAIEDAIFDVFGDDEEGWKDNYGEDEE